MDPKSMAREVFSAIKAMVARSQAPLAKKIAELEARPAPELREMTAKEKTAIVADLLPHHEAAFGKWALDFERRATETLQRAADAVPDPKNGIDGKDGADGRDGFGFDDLHVESDGERTIMLRFVRGDQIKEFRCVLPIVLDRGVFHAERSYEAGDGVTWAGSFWIAQKATQQKPGEGDGWRLAVKRGRDGKDGQKGERGLEGPKGRDGRDLTQMDFSGQKY